MAFLNHGLFMKVRKSWSDGTFRLTVKDFVRKLEIQVLAPKDSFVSLAGPMKDGFKMEYAHESFTSLAGVRVFTRKTVFQAWKLEESVSIPHFGEYLLFRLAAL